jgi:hypothetical protein
MDNEEFEHFMIIFNRKGRCGYSLSALRVLVFLNIFLVPKHVSSRQLNFESLNFEFLNP